GGRRSWEEKSRSCREKGGGWRSASASLQRYRDGNFGINYLSGAKNRNDSLAHACRWRRHLIPLLSRPIFAIRRVAQRYSQRWTDDMEVHFTPELEAKLTHSAAQQGRNPDELVQDVIRRYFEEEA